jgi:hypothetical protein
MAAWSEAQAADILRVHEGRDGDLLPILHDVQAAFWLDDDVREAIQRLEG